MDWEKTNLKIDGREVFFNGTEDYFAFIGKELNLKDYVDNPDILAQLLQYLIKNYRSNFGSISNKISELRHNYTMISEETEILSTLLINLQDEEQQIVYLKKWLMNDKYIEEIKQQDKNLQFIEISPSEELRFLKKHFAFGIKLDGIKELFLMITSFFGIEVDPDRIQLDKQIQWLKKQTNNIYQTFLFKSQQSEEQLIENKGEIKSNQTIDCKKNHSSDIFSRIIEAKNKYTFPFLDNKNNSIENEKQNRNEEDEQQFTNSKQQASMTISNEETPMEIEDESEFQNTIADANQKRTDQQPEVMIMDNQNSQDQFHEINEEFNNKAQQSSQIEEELNKQPYQIFIDENDLIEPEFEQYEQKAMREYEILQKQRKLYEKITNTYKKKTRNLVKKNENNQKQNGNEIQQPKRQVPSSQIQKEVQVEVINNNEIFSKNKCLPEVSVILSQLSQSQIEKYAANFVELKLYLEQIEKEQKLKILFYADYLQYSHVEQQSSEYKNTLRLGLNKIYKCLNSLLDNFDVNRNISVFPFMEKQIAGFSAKVEIFYHLNESQRKRKKIDQKKQFLEEFRTHHQYTAFIYGEAFCIRKLLEFLLDSEKIQNYSANELLLMLNDAENKTLKQFINNALQEKQSIVNGRKYQN